MKFENEVQLPERTSFFYVTLLAESDGNTWLDEISQAGARVDGGRVQTIEEIITTLPQPKTIPRLRLGALSPVLVLFVNTHCARYTRQVRWRTHKSE
jgi:hypothetical protein